MKFEFNPSEESVSFREYLAYVNTSSIVTSLYRKAIMPIVTISIFITIVSLYSNLYRRFFYTTGILTFGVLVLSIICFLGIKIIKSMKKKKLKNNKFICDIESISKFNIEDNFLIRENEFSTIKVSLDNITGITLLNHGLILHSKKNELHVFIPKETLPIPLDEFISIFKKENKNLLIDEGLKREKNKLKKIIAVCTIVFIIGIISAYFIGKYDYEHNYTRYNLIMEAGLTKMDNNTLVYENENLGFELIFSEKWHGKFGIEEFDDKINIYYLVNGEQSNNTTLLFTIRRTSDLTGELDFNAIKSKGDFTFLGPKTINIKINSDEYYEYMKLYKSVQYLKFYEH
ncbi:MAG: hypothetical protein RR620_02165 [Clostridium sp.]